jgi:transposase-like protein
VPWKMRKPVAADLGLIYRAATAAEAEQHLAEVEAKWKAYPSVSQVWRRNWARIIPFFNYPPELPPRLIRGRFSTELPEVNCDGSSPLKATH